MSTGLSLSDWVGIANLLAAVGAIAVAVVALVVARRTLTDAEESWRQQKWFDLYAKADQAHSTLLGYRQIYPVEVQDHSLEAKQAWNALMTVFLEAYTMAACFPKNAAIDTLLTATSAFTDPEVRLRCAAIRQVGRCRGGVAAESLIEAKRALIDRQGCGPGELVCCPFVAQTGDKHARTRPRDPVQTRMFPVLAL